MEIPYHITSYFGERHPLLFVPISFIMGIFHLFPPCCIISFTLGEFGQFLQNWLAVHSYSTSNFPIQFQQLESDYYDEERHMHLCKFHAKQAENIQSIPFKERSLYQRWLGKGGIRP